MIIKKNKMSIHNKIVIGSKTIESISFSRWEISQNGFAFPKIYISIK